MTLRLTSRDLADLTSYQLFEKLDELKSEAYRLGHEMAEAEKAFKDEKELLPVVLAEIQSNYIDCHEYGVTEAGVHARANSSYRSKLERCNELGHTFRLKEVAYKATMESIKAIQAIAYVRNGELRLARG